MTTGQDSDALDIRERGNDKDGQPISLDRRLFMQLLGFECASARHPTDAANALGTALAAAGVGAVIYEDVNLPRGLALLTFSENPEDFVSKVRPCVVAQPALTSRPELSMLGRSYSTGYERDLEYWLLRRPRETVLNEAWP